MIKLDHFTIFVTDYVASRDWYVDGFGFRVGFDNPEAGVGGLEDDGGVELILIRRNLEVRERDCALTLQCDSVHDTYRKLSERGITFVHQPMHVN
ncbi:MAG TPA: VOC family protein [Acidobacteriaceae bacterium]